jgi:cytochrome c peroxidase
LPTAPPPASIAITSLPGVLAVRTEAGRVRAATELFAGSATMGANAGVASTAGGVQGGETFATAAPAEPQTSEKTAAKTAHGRTMFFKETVSRQRTIGKAHAQTRAV